MSGNSASCSDLHVAAYWRLDKTTDLRMLNALRRGVAVFSEVTLIAADHHLVGSCACLHFLLDIVQGIGRKSRAAAS